jgi:hypothetical protein
MRYQLANLDDDMTNCPTIAVYDKREEAEALAKENGHTLYLYWNNYGGELHKHCLHCKHTVAILNRSGVVGLSGRATYLQCGQQPTFTHEVRYTWLDRLGKAVPKERQFENLDIAMAFTRTLHAGSFTVWTVEGEEVTL